MLSVIYRFGDFINQIQMHGFLIKVHLFQVALPSEVRASQRLGCPCPHGSSSIRIRMPIYETCAIHFRRIIGIFVRLTTYTILGKYK